MSRDVSISPARESGTHERKLPASYDASLRHGTQTPFNDTLSYMWEGGHWQADGTHDSIITVGNGGRKTIQTRFTLYYDEGKQHYDLEQGLKPHEQMWIDVGKLIRERVADKSGALLPPGLSMGAYAFRDLTDPAVGNLYEGKVILDKTFGQVAYGCAGCCAYQGDPYMYYDPINVAVSGQADQDVWDLDNCTGEYTSVRGAFLTGWGTDDSAIATASAAVVTGVGAGATTHYASGLEGVTGGKRCFPVERYPSGPVGVGQALELIGTNCKANPTYQYGGNWSNTASTCFLADNFVVPDGGACVQEGTLPGGGPKICYQTSVNGCVTTYCAVNGRIADSACTKFLDPGGETETKVGFVHDCAWLCQTV